jgi:hypothetical protein
MNIKQTVNTVGTAFAFSPFGLPLVVHGAAGMLVGTMGLKLVNGVINDLKGAGDALQQQMGKTDESQQDEEQEGI